MIRQILVVGGANGIGLSIATELANRNSTDIVYVVDKTPLKGQYSHPKIQSFLFDLSKDDYTFFDRFSSINALMITAGFGRLALFKDISEQHIIDSFNVNTISVLRIIKRFYPKMEECEDFYCGIMDSIAGWLSSPFFAVYSATKAALKIFIESVNVELEKAGSNNRILNVSPGSIQGTSFNQEETDLNKTRDLAQQIITHLEQKSDLFIPQYDEIYKTVLERYHRNFREEGRNSYDYKLRSDRIRE